MYVSDSSQTTYSQDFTSKGKNSQAFSSKFSFSDFQNNMKEDIEGSSSQSVQMDDYVKQLINFTSTQSAEYSIAKAKEEQDVQTEETQSVTDENSNEETQKTQKDQEQFELAMKAYGLNPKNTKDVFMMELIQKGYSKNEAFERSNVYQSAGLLTNDDGVEYAINGFEVHSLSFAAFNPVYKQSLKEAFDQMDTQQLKKVASKLAPQSMSMEDLKKIMPLDEPKSPEEVHAGLQEYWDKRYGTPEKVSTIFENALKSIERDEKFSGEDLTYIKEGVDIVSNTYSKNIAQNETQEAIDRSNRTTTQSTDKTQEQKDEEQQTQKTDQSSATSETAQTEESKEDYYARLQRLFEDIKSVARTGLTVGELEQLREKIEEQIKKLKEENGSLNDDKIADLVKQLEDMLKAYKKKMNGHVIIKVQNNTIQNTNADELKKGLNTLLQTIEEIKSEVKKDKEDSKSSTHENSLDADSTKNSFIEELTQSGTSKDEASTRADIYQSVGLFTSSNTIGSIFNFETSSFSSMTLDPTYKKALRDAFDQMDTDQLQKVTSDLTSRFSIDMEELKKKIPQNLQVSDALLKGFDDYEGYRFGSPGKLFEMFGKMMDQADMTERLTGVDQTELKDGINKVIDAYKRTLTI